MGEISYGCQFSKYVSYHAKLSTCETLHYNKVINSSSNRLNEGDVEEMKHAPFKKEARSFQTLKQYLMAHYVNDTVFTVLKKKNR